MTGINRLVKNYYRKTLNYSAVRYIAEIVILIILFKLTFAFTGLTIGEFFSSDFSETQLEKNFEYQNLSEKHLILIVVLIVPCIETMLFQWAPIQLLKKITNNYIIIILLTGFIFAIAHLSYDILYAFSMLPYGLVFSWIFYCKQKQSLWIAFFYTSAVHAGANLISVIFIIAGR